MESQRVHVLLLYLKPIGGKLLDVPGPEFLITKSAYELADLYYRLVREDTTYSLSDRACAS